MNNFSKWIVRFCGIALFLCLFAGIMVTGSSSTHAQTQRVLGSSTNHGITLKINHYAIIHNGRRIRVSYTIRSTSRHPRRNLHGRLMETPYIWIGDTLIRGDHEKDRKIGDHVYKGVVEASLHQYRSAEEPHMSFRTYSILNQEGKWKIDFVLKNT